MKRRVKYLTKNPDFEVTVNGFTYATHKEKMNVFSAFAGKDSVLDSKVEYSDQYVEACFDLAHLNRSGWAAYLETDSLDTEKEHTSLFLVAIHFGASQEFGRNSRCSSGNELN